MATLRFLRVKVSHRQTAALIILLSSSASIAPAQTAKPSEYQVKAAYLANFVKFIEWPARAGVPADEPFNICILGSDPFGPALDAALAGESVGRHALAARKVANAREAANCRVLFLNADDNEVQKTLSALDKASILTVSDLPQFLKRGGMIQFVLEGNKVRFEVNLAAAKSAGLNLSSELLKVAAAVRRNP